MQYIGKCQTSLPLNLIRTRKEGEREKEKPLGNGKAYEKLFVVEPKDEARLNI